MKICILGGTGQLGKELNENLKENNIISLSSKDINITNLDEVHNVLREIKPGVVIHAAGYSDIDGCEKDPKYAYEINAMGTKNVAKVVESLGGKLIYISTDYVFEGTKEGYYNENDEANPINIYGKSKYYGELLVKENMEKYFIVRTPLIIGHRSKDFIKNIINLSNNNTLLKIISDQKRNPTYSMDFSIALMELLNNEYYGTYHLVNEGSCSWYELIEYILRKKNMVTKIIPMKSKEVKWNAPRPKNTSLNNNSKIKLRPWQEAMDDYLNHN